MSSSGSEGVVDWATGKTLLCLDRGLGSALRYTPRGLDPHLASSQAGAKR